MKKILLSIVTILFISSANFAQDSCLTAVEYCTGTAPSFNMPTGVTAPTGPSYGCLLTQHSPYWWYFRCTTAGYMDFTMSATAGGSSDDIDFIVWGPFTDLSGACGSGLDASHIIDCDYTTGTLDTITVPSAILGDYYVVMLSNFAEQPSVVTYSQMTGPGQASCIVTGINELAVNGKLDVFPNPTDDGKLSVRFEDVGLKSASFEMTDVLGRIVYREDINDFSGKYQKEMDISKYQKGVYLFKVKGSNGFITKKIIYN